MVLVIASVGGGEKFPLSIGGTLQKIIEKHWAKGSLSKLLEYHNMESDLSWNFLPEKRCREAKNTIASKKWWPVPLPSFDAPEKDINKDFNTSRSLRGEMLENAISLRSQLI